MKIKKLLKGRALYTEPDRIWVAQGMTFFAVDYSGKQVTMKYSVGGRKEGLLASNRLSRQLLRQGLHHLVPLPDGSVFVTARRIAYVVDRNGNVVHEFTGYKGNKPCHHGVCVTPDGALFFGEYTINLDHKNETRLFRSADMGRSFEEVLRFGKNDIRHIHFIEWDPYEECLWLGTGDADNECFLMCSHDNGDSWETVGEGCQDWRAIGVCFDPKYLIWGTDAGSVPDQNHINRMNRKTRSLETIADVEGPCHGCGSFKGGKVFISTGIEGGENEVDHFAHLKRVDGSGAAELLKIEKDAMPLLMQYGVIRFPLGTENTDNVVFTTFGLKSYGECVCILKE